VTIIILACFSKALDKEGEYNQLDAVWRIQMGLGLVPAFATLWARLTMPEGRKYIQSQELNKSSSSSSSTYKETTLSSKAVKESPVNPLDTPTSLPSNASSSVDPATPVMANALADSTVRKSKYSTFFIYFSEWRHLKTLLGTTSCWFLLDVAFYGTNLNQSVLLADIGFSTGKNEYDVLMRNTLGNLIIAVSGYVPGYFFTIYFIEKLGRRWIQIQGFLICALMFAIIAGGNNHLGTAGKFVCFTIAQVQRLHSFFKHFYCIPSKYR
jgi:PHS family inorganic phosphate transporter-like MFS transporter